MPEMEFAEYIFKTEICLTKSPTVDAKQTKEIAKWISALMNTSGGLIVLYSNRPNFDRKRDYWIMSFESVLINNWISESLLHSLLRYQFTERNGQLRIYIFVSQSPYLITFNLYAFERRETGLRPIKDPHRVREMLKESIHSASSTECLSQIYEIEEYHSFRVNEPIPVAYRESQTIAFKHCYKRESELPIFEVTRLIDLLGEYMQYLSAFANTRGGSLVLGVEESEKFPLVRGFPVTQNQEADESLITEYLAKRLEKCIWHGDPEYRPVRGQDWNVFYHKVLEEDGGERRMIEVRIAKHSGGMFLQPPVHYVVKGNGDMEENRVYQEWRSHFQTDTLNVDNIYKQDHLQKHVESLSTELSDQDVPNSARSNIPQFQSQLDTASTAVASKQPKSFRESQSEHKSDIVVQRLRMHDCCTNTMMKHIKKCAGDNKWFPSSEHTLKRLPMDATSETLMTFLQTQGWHGVASVIDILKESNTNAFHLPTPGGHSLICHVLIIREHESPVLLCCMRDWSHCEVTKQDLDIMVGYALDSGRTLKRKFVMGTANKQHQTSMFHFHVKVLLVSTGGEIRIVWDSMEKQPVTYPDANRDIHYTVACTGLANELLRTRASVKDRYGQVLIEHLTEAQAKILLEKPERVLVVNGKSGTGKTAIALHMMMETMEEGSVTEDVVYICSTEGLKAFVSSQVSCQVIVLKNTNSLNIYHQNMLKKAKLIIVDDVHAIKLDEHWQTNHTDLYMTLFTHTRSPNIRVTVFYDEEQDYKKHLPNNFSERLRDLAERTPGMLPEDIKIVTLTHRIRNSQEVNRFMQANQNQANIPGRIVCLNESTGDDVIYDYLGSSLEENGKILNARLDALGKKYEARSIAILCDDTEQLSAIKTLLTKKFKTKFQEENEYPIHHMAICSLEEFGGLEAEVVLFLLPHTFGTWEVKVIWKYVNMISSRARERLELLLPWDPFSDRREYQEQENLTDLLELFKMVG